MSAACPTRLLRVRFPQYQLKRLPDFPGAETSSSRRDAMFVSSISVVTPMDEKSTSRVRSEVAVIGGGVDINPRLVLVRRTDEPATNRTTNLPRRHRRARSHR
jgi:hypothetical protein